MTAIDDLTRLGHIRDAAREALAFSTGETRETLEENRLLQLAIARILEILGEAANHISVDCRQKYPDIPWARMIGMRNRLIHAYFGVDLDVVWQTVREDLEPLLAKVEAALLTEKENNN